MIKNNSLIRIVRPSTEATATAALQEFFYCGVGKKFLGWQITAEEQQDDGSWKKLGKDGWRHWTVPVERMDRLKWHPVHDHLKGLNRGWVSIGSLFLPCVTADLDRHTESVDPKDHIVRVLKAGRLLRKHFPQLSWIVEVNPKNGSAKFFGFCRRPIPIAEANKWATQIHKLLLKNGCGAINHRGQREVEVFPHNCVQVGLPMRTDKTTIVSSGVLPKCVRRKKNDDGLYEEYETYSALALLREIMSGDSYDEETLVRELKRGCSNLPFVPAVIATTPMREATSSAIDEYEVVEIVTDAPLGPIVSRVRARLSARVCKVQGDYRDDPNAYMRQLGAMLELCRRLKRVATVEEGLQFIRANGLFSGDWSQNESRRKLRVAYLLNWVALTFDPAKCCGLNPRRGAKSPINIGKYDNWARNHVGKVKGTRRSVNEYGDVVERRSVSVDWKWVSVFLSIVEHCCVVSPNEDGSVPEAWGEFIWRSLTDTGVVSLKWDDRKWKVARDWLEKKGVIKIVDRHWHFGHGEGQAMIWAVGKDFDRLHVWWKRAKEAAANLDMPLREFLKILTHTAGLKAYPHRADSNSGSAGYQSQESASRGPP